MRLLLVNYEYPPIRGGAANATYFLALAGLGHEPWVLTSAFDLPHRRRRGLPRAGGPAPR